MLNDPEARISVDAEQAVWAAALEATGDPTLPLRAAALVRGEDYRVLLWLGRHSPTVGEALSRVARWFSLVNRDVSLSVKPGATPALVFTVASLPAPLPRAAVDYTLAVTTLRMREATSGALQLLRVDVPYPAPADRVAEGLFGCPVRHNSGRAALVCTPAGWQAPVPGADAALGRILEEHAALLVERIPANSDWLDDVEKAIAIALPDGAPSVADAARGLGLGARTLQRRLGSRGLTYKEVLDGVRERLARMHLTDTSLSLAEVAFLLGFSDQSAFTRAFKRWTGRTPASVRRSRPSGDGASIGH